MKLMLKVGSTSQTIDVFIGDSASTVGAGKTGLAYNSAGIKCYYIKPGAAPVAITLVTQTPTGSYSSGGFCEIDATNTPGWYRLDLPNTAINTGSQVGISLMGASGMAPCNAELQLVAYNPDDSASMGLSKFDSVALSAAGVLAIWHQLVSGITTANTIGKLISDNLNATVSSRSTLTAANVWDALTSGLTTNGSIGKFFMDNWTAARAAFLDKLNITGNVASSAEVLNISNNTRVRGTLPQVLERPDTGSESVPLVIELYDEVGNMEAPDSTPTVVLTGQDGTDLSARVSALSNPSTGRYTFNYTNAAAHALEVLRWSVSVVEGGLARTYSYLTQLVDTTAVDFTSADRAKLNTLHDDRLTAGRAANLDAITEARLAELGAANLPADIDTLKTRIPGTVQPQTGDAYARLGAPAGASVSVDIAAAKADTAAIKITTDRLNGMLVIDGAVYQFTANALELAPSGGGGGGSASLVLLRGLTLQIDANEPGETLRLMQGSNLSLLVTLLDGSGDPVPLAGFMVTAQIRAADGTVALSPTVTVESESTGQVSFAIPETFTATAQRDLTLTVKLDGGTGNVHVTYPTEVEVRAR
jgi:hypothetical protein